MPGSPSCVTNLTCLGRPKGVGVGSGQRGVFAWEGVIPSPGERAVAGDALASPGGRAVA